MDKFISIGDDLATLIQDRSDKLYRRLKRIDPDRLGMPDHCLEYFKSSHSRRLFFSIQTSAHLLYNAIRLTGKNPEQLVLMDYGAGVGTLFLLAKMTGFSKVIYNDHLADWKKSAQLIADAAGISIDHYIVGDIGESLDMLDELDVRCDVITSRNVIEHIYKLDVFFRLIHNKQPHAIVYSSTTANRSNPASVLKHRMWHRKWEKVYKGKRAVVIERQAPGLSPRKMDRLARSTRGLAADELRAAIDQYRKTSVRPDASVHGSNTCDPATGVWAEHLLSMEDYRKLIGEDIYKVSFAPGFWDNHYPKKSMNMLASILNRVIAKNGSMAMHLAPFIYVIAEPRNQ